jgi:phosphatidylglycerol lysyltransferase
MMDVETKPDEASPSSPARRMRALVPKLLPFVTLALVVAAFVLLREQLRHFHFRDVKAALRELPRARVGLALALTCLSYVVITGYDALGIRYIERRLPFRRIAFAAFEGFAFSQNFSGAGLTGASIRYRLYTGWGLSAGEVAALVVFNSISFWFGYVTLVGLALCFVPAASTSVLHLPAAALQPLGVLITLGSAALLAVNARRTRPWKVMRWAVRPPPLDLALGQLLVSALDWSLAALILFVLLPPGSVSYGALALTFLLAQFAGLVSHVPGGLGVFETVMLTTLGAQVGVAPLLAALAVFRAVYYLLPLLVAVLLLVGSELLRPERARALVRAAGGRVSSLIPPLFAAAVFYVGVVLLMSGATPAVTARLAKLKEHLPLPLLELSHFLASVVGALLLLLARGIQRRQQGAFVVAVVLLGAGVAFSLLKGLDYEEATLLALVMVALLPCHEAFYRRASLLDERFTAGWVAAILIVVAGSIGLVVFANRHTDYAAELWWQFTFRGDAPRSLRAEVGVVLVLLLAAILRLSSPPRLPGGAVVGEIDRVRPLVASTKSTTAALALLGDKRFLFSNSGRCGIMYGVRGRSWVALGDPIGEEASQAELIWAFRELSDRHGGWAAFYQVGTEHASIYRDIGLGQFKLGEEARVPLDGFSLQGSQRKSLRQSHNHAKREGLSFEILPREAVPALMPELAAISNDWLASKRTSEKGFSLGYFDQRYLAAFPLAVVRQHDRLLAFANLFEGAAKEELSIDLMRHRTQAPNGVMDFLFLELMLWGAAAGYHWFNLGMAPLAGLGSDKLAPLWERAGSLVFRYGDQFYNFEGLRKYKAKFDPVWTPRYLACPGGLALPVILADIAALVAGGAGGLVGVPVRRRSPPGVVMVGS